MDHPFARRVAALPDEVYGDARREDERLQALPADAIELDFRGLLLGAPRRVDLDAGDALWTFLVRAGVPRDDVPFIRNATLVATDLEHGHVFADRGLKPDSTKYGAEDVEDLPLPPPAPPPSPQQLALGEGMSAGLVWFDFLRELSLPRASGRWALRVVSFDQRSNDVVVETSARRAPAGTPAEATHPLLAAPRGTDAPALKAPGAVLSVAGTPSPTSLVLHGVLRLEATSAMFTSSPPMARAKILLLAKNHSAPAQVPLSIPVPPGRPGELLDLRFSVDVRDALPQRPAGDWQAYLVAGRHLSAPLLLRF